MRSVQIASTSSSSSWAARTLPGCSSGQGQVPTGLLLRLTQSLAAREMITKELVLYLAPSGGSQDTARIGASLAKGFPAVGREDWFATQRRKLGQIESLEPGWDGYAAPAPGSLSAILAQVFLETLHAADLQPSRLAASVMGGIAFAFTRGDREAFVEFYSDGQICAMFSLLSVPDEEPMIALVPQERSAFLQLADDIKAFLYG